MDLGIFWFGVWLYIEWLPFTFLSPDLDSMSSIISSSGMGKNKGQCQLFFSIPSHYHCVSSCHRTIPSTISSFTQCMHFSHPGRSFYPPWRRQRRHLLSFQIPIPVPVHCKISLTFPFLPRNFPGQWTTMSDCGRISTSTKHGVITDKGLFFYFGSTCFLHRSFPKAHH